MSDFDPPDFSDIFPDWLLDKAAIPEDSSLRKPLSMVKEDALERLYVDEQEQSRTRRVTMNMLHGIKIKANKNEVLKKLKENREKHAQIVKEAREGYVEKAEKALQRKLGQIKEGKLVSLHFSLNPPKDYTSVYDTAISMLEYSTEDIVELNSEQVRNLIQDDWDWKHDFLSSNSMYSDTAAASVE